MRVVVLIAAALLAGACGPRTASLEGKNPEQMTKDEAQCRAQVRAQTQYQRNLDDQRRDVFYGDRERYSQQDLNSTMDNQSYKNSVDRLTARCMQARGWSTKGTSWWQRGLTFDTPLGGK